MLARNTVQTVRYKLTIKDFKHILINVAQYLCVKFFLIKSL